jgi:hypothetical protein
VIARGRHVVIWRFFDDPGVASMAHRHDSHGVRQHRWGPSIAHPGPISSLSSPVQGLYDSCLVVIRWKVSVALYLGLTVQ